MQLAAEAAERARDQERQRFQAEIAAAEARAREAEGARLAVETAAAAARAREADRAAAERTRTEERDREEERREREARAMAEVHRAREEERRRLEVELAAERQRTADAIAAGGHAREAASSSLPSSASTDEPGETALGVEPLVAADPFAQFREEYDHVGPAVLRHLPLTAWARTERPQPVAGAPGRAERDMVRELLEGLALPAHVAEVTYARGCRIRRVRVPAVPAEPPAGNRQPVILSRRALDEARSPMR